MRKSTLIIGNPRSGKSTKAKELVLYRNRKWYSDRDEYIQFKFPLNTEVIVFDGLDVINNKYDLNFIDKLSKSNDVLIKSISGKYNKVQMPEIIVIASCNINDPVPEIFKDTDRWIILNCNH